MAALVLRQRRLDRVHQWPTVEATIETCELQNAGRQYVQYVICWLGYSYRVQGTLYSGEFGLSVPDRDTGFFKGEEFKGKTIVARYNPSFPRKSVVLSEDFGRSVISSRRRFRTF